MRSSHVLRRMAGDPLNYRNGILMATGAFVFQDEGVWKILTQTQLDHFRALAGDPRTLQAQPSRLHMHYAQTSGEVSNFFFKSAIFGNRLTKPLEDLDTDIHPVDTNRVWRHYSDNLAVMARTTDLDIEGNAEDGYGLDVTINGVVERFDFEAINPGAGGINGDFSKVLDTYFGGIIGMDDYVYIGAPRQGDTSTIVGYICDGFSMAPVGQPDDAFFYSLFDQIMDNYTVTYRSLIRAKPLCRFSPDTMLCRSDVSIIGAGDFFFPDHEDFEWMLHYMYVPYLVLNPIPSALLSEDTNNGLIPSPHEVGMVSMLPGSVRLRCQVDGVVSCLIAMNNHAFSQPYATSRSGNFQVSGITIDGNLVPRGQANVRPEPFVVRKRLDGPYELWLADDPNFPADPNQEYETFSAKWRNGQYGRGNLNALSVGYSQIGPNRNAPYPTDQQHYGYGERVVAAAPYGSTFFVLTRAFNDMLGITEGRAGLLGATYTSPSGFLQRQPRVAGPFVFLDDDFITIDQGQSWVPCGHVWGAGYKSAGARSLDWRFGFTKSEIEAAVPV